MVTCLLTGAYGVMCLWSGYRWGRKEGWRKGFLDGSKFRR